MSNKNICAQSIIQPNQTKIKKTYNRNNKNKSPQLLKHSHKPLFKEMIDKTQNQSYLYTKNYKKSLEYINNKMMAVSSSYMPPNNSPNKMRKMMDQTSRKSPIYDAKTESSRNHNPKYNKHMMNSKISKHIHAQNGLMADLEFDADNSYETEDPIPHVPIPMSPDNSSLENLKNIKTANNSYRNSRELSFKHSSKKGCLKNTSERNANRQLHNTYRETDNHQSLDKFIENTGNKFLKNSQQESSYQTIKKDIVYNAEMNTPVSNVKYTRKYPINNSYKTIRRSQTDKKRNNATIDDIEKRQQSNGTHQRMLTISTDIDKPLKYKQAEPPIKHQINQEVEKQPMNKENGIVYTIKEKIDPLLSVFSSGIGIKNPKSASNSTSDNKLESSKS